MPKGRRNPARFASIIKQLKRTRYLSGLRDHLDSPQFTDENGESTGETAFRFGGSWVKSGAPRWKGYLFYAISFFGGRMSRTSWNFGEGLRDG